MRTTGKNESKMKPEVIILRFTAINEKKGKFHDMFWVPPKNIKKITRITDVTRSRNNRITKKHYRLWRSKK